VSLYTPFSSYGTRNVIPLSQAGTDTAGYHTHIHTHTHTLPTNKNQSMSKGKSLLLY